MTALRKEIESIFLLLRISVNDQETEEEYDEYYDTMDQPKSVHSLEKRRIHSKPTEGPNASSIRSIRMDGTQSPTGEKVSDDRLYKRSLMNRLGSNMSQSPPRAKAQLDRLDSFESSIPTRKGGRSDGLSEKESSPSRQSNQSGTHQLDSPKQKNRAPPSLFGTKTMSKSYHNNNLGG